MTITIAISAGRVTVTRAQDGVEQARTSVSYHELGVQSVVAQFPELASLSLHFDPEGNCYLAGDATGFDLSINTPHALIIAKPTQLGSARLQADKILLTESLHAKKLIVHAQSRVDVLADVHSDNLSLQAEQGAVSNFARVCAVERCVIKAATLQNEGAFTTAQFQSVQKRFLNNGLLETQSLQLKGVNNKARIRNNGTIKADSAKITNLASLDNKAIILVKQLLVRTLAELDNMGRIIAKVVDVDFSQTLNNHSQAFLVAEKLSFTGKKALFFRNQGQIIGQDSLSICCEDGLVECGKQGIIHADNQLTISSQSFSNNGALSAADCQLVSSGKNNCFNQRSGRIQANRFRFSGFGRFNNLGHVKTQEKCSVKTLDKIENSGVIASAKKLRLASVTDIINEATVQSALVALSSETLSNTFTAETNAEVLRAQHQTVNNHGGLFTTQLDIATKQFNGGEGSEIVAKRDIHLLATDSVHHEGKMQAARRLILTSYGEVVNGRCAEIQADSIDIAANSVTNHGMIAATSYHLIETAGKLMQSQHGRLLSQQALFLLANDDIELGGVVDAQAHVLVAAAQRLAIEHGALIRANGEVNLQSDESLVVAGGLESQAAVVCQASHELILTAEAACEAPLAVLQAQTIQTAARIVARRITIEGKQQFEQLLSGLLLSTQCVIHSPKVVNGGQVNAEQIDLNDCQRLFNLASGQIVSSQDLLIRVAESLINAGSMMSDNDVCLRAGQLLRNMATGRMVAAKHIDLQSLGYIDNAGMVQATESLTIHVIEALHNVQQGQLNARGAITLLSEKIVNAGSIQAGDRLHLTVNALLENTRTGLISAEQALDLISAALVANNGVIRSQDINIDVQDAFINFAHGRVQAEHLLRILSQNIIENAGTLVAHAAELEATNKLSNTHTGQLIVATRLQLQTQELEQAGRIMAQRMDCQANTLTNCLGGIIVASTHASIQAQLLENMGTIAAEKLIARIALVLNNWQQGRLVANDELLLVAGTVLKNSGKISANQMLISAGERLDNTTSGEIDSREKCAIITRRLRNANRISAGDPLVLALLQLLKRWQSGSLNPQQLIAHLHELDSIDLVKVNQGDPVHLLLAGLQEQDLSPDDAPAIIESVTASLVLITVEQAQGEIQLDVKDVIENLASGTISADKALTLLASVVDNQGELSSRVVDIQAAEQLVNGESGRMFALARLQVQAKKIRNAGHMLAEKAQLVAEGEIENLLSAMIIISAQCQVDAKSLTNQGLIEAEHLNAALLECFHNWDQGQIVSHHDLSILAKRLINQGRWQADGNTTLKITKLLENHGAMHLNGVLHCLGQAAFKNLGKIHTSDQLQIHVEQALINYRQGTINATEALHLIAQKDLINHGEISSGNSLHVVVAGLLENNTTLSAEKQLSIIASTWLNNYGDIHSDGSASIKANKTLRNVQQGRISAQQALQILCDTMLDNAGKIEAEQLALEARETLLNHETGEMVGRSVLSARAKSIKNAGKLLAKNIQLRAETDLENCLAGIIIAASQCQIDSQTIDNRNLISAQNLLLNCADIFKNFASGELVAAGDLQIVATRLINAGSVRHDPNVYTAANIVAHTSTSTEFTRNVVSAIQEGILTPDNNPQLKQVLAVLAQYSEKQLTADDAIAQLNDLMQLPQSDALRAILNDFNNQQLNAQQSLIAITAHVVENSGSITAQESITIHAQETLANLASGQITAQRALTVFSDLVIRNQGQMRATALKLTAQQAIKNMSHALIHGDDYLEINAKESFHNQQDATIDGGDVFITTQHGINDGRIQATDDICLAELSEQGRFTQRGELSAGRQIEFKFSWFDNTGTISAKSILFDVKNILENHGSISAEDKIFMIRRAQQVINRGDISAQNLLKVLAETLEQEGTIAADKAIMLDAVDLYLRGHEKAVGDLVFLAENNFEYDSAKLSADGMLSLKLKDGSVLNSPVNTKGSLMLQLHPASSAKQFDLRAELSSGNDLSINLPGVILLNRKQLTAQQNVVIKADSIDNQASITGQNGYFEALAGDITHGARWHGKTMPNQAPVLGFSQRLQLKASQKVSLDGGEAYANTLHLEADDLTLQHAQIGTAGSATLKARQAKVGEQGVLQVGGHLDAQVDDLTVGIDRNVRDSDIAAYQAQHQLSDFVEDAPHHADVSESFAKTGGISAQTAHFKGHKATITGEVVTEGDLRTDIDHLTVQKRQYHYDQTVTDVHKSSSWWGLKKKTKRTTRTIHCKEAQGGGVLKSLNGKLFSRGHTLLVKGGEFAGAAGVAGEFRDHAGYEYIEDVQVGHHSSHASSGFVGFSSRSSSTHHAVQTIKKGSLRSEHSVVNLKVTEGSLDLRGAEVISRDDVILYARDGIHFQAAITEVDMGVRHRSSGLFDLSSQHVTRQEAHQNDIASLQGNVFIMSDGAITGDAPNIVANKNIAIKGTEIDLQSALVGYNIDENKSEVSGLTYKETDTHIHGQHVQRSTFFAGGSMMIHATDGSVRLRALNLLAGHDDDEIHIQAKQNVTLDGFQTEHELSQHELAVGLSFTGSQAVTALAQGDVDKAGQAIAHQLFPTSGALARLLSADNNADRLGEGIKAGYSAYKTYKGIAEAGMGGYAQQQFSPSVGLSVDVTETTSRWTQSEGTHVNAGALTVVAEEGDANFTQMTLDKQLQALSVSAGRDVNFRVYQDVSSSQQNSVGATVSFGANGWGGEVRGSESDQQSSTYGKNEYQLKHFNLQAGRHANFDNTHITADVTRVRAQRLNVTTLLNHQQASSRQGAIGTSNVSYQESQSKTQSASVQSGLHVIQEGDIEVDTLALTGAALTAHDEAQVKVKAKHLQHQDVTAKSSSRGVGFSADGEYLDASFHAAQQQDQYRATIDSRIDLITDADTSELHRDAEHTQHHSSKRQDVRVVLPTEIARAGQEQLAETLERARDLQHQAELAVMESHPEQNSDDMTTLEGHSAPDERAPIEPIPMPQAEPNDIEQTFAHEEQRSRQVRKPHRHVSPQPEPDSEQPKPPQPKPAPASKKVTESKPAASELTRDEPVPLVSNNYETDKNGTRRRRDTKTGKFTKKLGERLKEEGGSTPDLLTVEKPKIKFGERQQFFKKHTESGELSGDGWFKTGVKYSASVEAGAEGNVEYSEGKFTGNGSISMKAQQGFTLLQCDIPKHEHQGDGFSFKNTTDCDVKALHTEVSLEAKVTVDPKQKQLEAKMGGKGSASLFSGMVQNETEACVNVPTSWDSLVNGKTDKQLCVNYKMKANGFVVGGGAGAEAGVGNYKNKTKIRQRVGAGGSFGWLAARLDYLDLSFSLKPKPTPVVPSTPALK